jgi:hypothetical protein
MSDHAGGRPRRRTRSAPYLIPVTGGPSWCEITSRSCDVRDPGQVDALFGEAVSLANPLVSLRG